MAIIKPQHSMSYLGRITVDYHTTSGLFFDLFNEFFDRKIEGKLVEVAYFDVSRLTNRQLESAAKSNMAFLRHIKTLGVTDFAVIDGKFFIKDFSKYELSENGRLFIDMSVLDYDDRNYGGFNFYLNVNFTLPIREVVL